MKLFLLITVMCFLCVEAFPQTNELRYETHGFHADWYEAPNNTGRVIITLGGSEGGNQFGNNWSEILNGKGYHVLSLSYFRETGLPHELEEVPLEYMDEALAWLHRNGTRRWEFIALVGVSKGAELALLQGSRHEFDSVVAVAPSSVVWQSINQSDYTSRKSSWTLEGKPLEYLPYDFSGGFRGIHALYDNAITNTENAEDVAIPVEKIRAPVLLISGGDDALWPSERMAGLIQERLKAHGKEAEHLHIAEAGHLLLAPGLKSADSVDEQTIQFLGGSAENIVEHTRQAEQAIYDFLEKHRQALVGD